MLFFTKTPILGTKNIVTDFIMDFISYLLLMLFYWGMHKIFFCKFLNILFNYCSELNMDGKHIFWYLSMIILPAGISWV